MKPTLITLVNTDPVFYKILGPYLANRDVHKQLGGVPWDDDEKTWYVLRDHATTGRPVLGFAAVSAHSGRTTVESLYLADPAHKRVATELVAAIAHTHGKTINLHATVRREAAYAYEAAGFRIDTEKVNFVTLVRDAK